MFAFHHEPILSISLCTPLVLVLTCLFATLNDTTSNVAFGLICKVKEGFPPLPGRTDAKVLADGASQPDCAASSPSR